jgi:hypothetical protein
MPVVLTAKKNSEDTTFRQGITLPKKGDTHTVCITVGDRERSQRVELFVIRYLEQTEEYMPAYQIFAFDEQKRVTRQIAEVAVLNYDPDIPPEAYVQVDTNFDSSSGSESDYRLDLHLKGVSTVRLSNQLPNTRLSESNPMLRVHIEVEHVWFENGREIRKPASAMS